jgi:hypothetical protein
MNLSIVLILAQLAVAGGGFRLDGGRRWDGFLQQ